MISSRNSFLDSIYLKIDKMLKNTIESVSSSLPTLFYTAAEFWMCNWTTDSLMKSWVKAVEIKKTPMSLNTFWNSNSYLLMKCQMLNANMLSKTFLFWDVDIDKLVMLTRKPVKAIEVLCLSVIKANMISTMIRPMNSSPTELVFQMKFLPSSFDIRTNAKS